MEMKEKAELTVSKKKKNVTLKTEDYSKNVFDRCFNLFSHENVVPCGKVSIADIIFVFFSNGYDQASKKNSHHQATLHSIRIC